MVVGVLISGGGTNLQAIIDNQKNIGIDVSVVISSNENAFGLTRARNSGIDSFFEKDERKIIEILKNYKVDLVVLAGYLKIISKDFVDSFKIINVHPSLIPSFCGKGFYGKKVHQAVLDYGVKVTGATVHFVDYGADTGAIIRQKVVEVSDFDTVETLSKKVLKIEHEILIESIKLIKDDKLRLDGRKVYESIN